MIFTRAGSARTRKRAAVASASSSESDGAPSGRQHSISSSSCIDARQYIDSGRSVKDRIRKAGPGLLRPLAEIAVGETAEGELPLRIDPQERAGPAEGRE